VRGPVSRPDHNAPQDGHSGTRWTGHCTGLKVGLQEVTKTNISIPAGDRMQIFCPRNPHYTDWATQLAVCCCTFVTSGNKIRKRRQYVTPKRWYSPTRLYGVTSQKITICIFIADSYTPQHTVLILSDNCRLSHPRRYPTVPVGSRMSGFTLIR